MNRRATTRDHGFTLIEVMVVIAFILILLGVALPIYSHALTRKREENLRHNLELLNSLIFEYTLDKQKPPQSLEDLKAEKYLDEIPKDITDRDDTWVTEPADAILSLQQKDTDGIIGVHSGSDKIGSDGKAYSTW
ncbi:MAG: type II secretion system protein [Terriglobales bacterium]